MEKKEIEFGGLKRHWPIHAADNRPAFLCAYLIVIVVLCFALAEQRIALPSPSNTMPSHRCV